MKKYKLIKTIALSTPIVVTPLIANSCNDPIFKRNDLSTWGDKQKNMINNYLISEAKKKYDNWPDPTTPKTWEHFRFARYDLNDALDLVNALTNLDNEDSSGNGNVAWQYLKDGDYDTDAKAVLSKGVTLFFTAEKIASGVQFSGTMTITIKGNI